MSDESITPPGIREDNNQIIQQMTASEYAALRARERTRTREMNRRMKELRGHGLTHHEAFRVYDYEVTERHNVRRLEEERRRLEEELAYIAETGSPRPIYSPNDRAAGYIRYYYNKSKKKKKRKRKKTRKNKKIKYSNKW